MTGTMHAELDLTDEQAGTSDDADVPSRTWRERGASLVEYSLVLALIALVCLAGISMLGGETNEGPRGIDRSASSIITAGGG